MAANVYLWAKNGTISLPGIGPVPFWGFAPSAVGVAQLPGPIIEVFQNDSVQVTLNNNLTTPVSIIFSGQEFTPVPVTDGSGLFLSYNQEAPSGGAFSYNITPNRPGIFLYESGTSPEKQIQMGLYGVMVVRPPGYDPAIPATWTAYGSGTGTEYDVEKILVIGEVDTAMHNAVTAGNPPGTFDPDYFIINGRSYPDSVAPDNNGSQPYSAGIAAATGQRVLLRIINAGFLNHTLRLLGISPRVLAGDSWPLKSASLDATFEKNTITLGSGQSYDLLFTAPSPNQYVIYDRDLNHAVNGNDFPGGIMTVINIANP